MRVNAYAPISYFETIELSPSSATVRGFARPDAGLKPCALALMAGTVMISTTAAVSFSPEAQSRGIRLGWCGFEIGGLRQAIALGADVELRCLVTDKLQVRWEGAEIAKILNASSRRHLSVEAMLAKLREKEICSDIEQILPFSIDLAKKRGRLSYLEASFTCLLGRLPDAGAMTNFSDDYSTIEASRLCWHNIMGSPEYKSRGRYYLPAPFTPTFPFPIDIIDENLG